jgi:NADP-dependent 3-hydroxy acid dehydrogenase YdfG
MIHPRNVKDAFSLDGKVVVLTGAAGIIGTQVVKAFVEAGARVFAIDRDADVLLDRLGPVHASLITCVADVSQKPSLVAAHALLASRWGEADGLLNNAAT